MQTRYGVVCVIVVGLSAAAADEPELLDLNKATQQQLEALPGIGPAKAKAILDARAKAPFQSVDELDWVPGISPAMLEKLRPLITVLKEEPPQEKLPGKKVAAPPRKPKASSTKKTPAPRRSDVKKKAPDKPAPPLSMQDAELARLRDFQSRLDIYTTAQLKALLAEKKVEFQRWCDQNNVSTSGVLKKDFASTRAREAALVATVREWKLRLTAIEEVLKQREKTVK